MTDKKALTIVDKIKAIRLKLGSDDKVVGNGIKLNLC